MSVAVSLRHKNDRAPHELYKASDACGARPFLRLDDMSVDPNLDSVVSAPL